MPPFPPKPGAPGSPGAPAPTAAAPAAPKPAPGALDSARAALLALLDAHPSADTREARDVGHIAAFVRKNPGCFSRSNPGGHITASAYVVEPTGERVLLTFHRGLGRWLQVGGHCEPGDGGDPVLAALREAREESGLTDLRFLSPRAAPPQLKPGWPVPVDIDVHRIPARGGARPEPEHDHLDLRYVLQTRTPEAIAHDPDESVALRWFAWDEMKDLGLDPPLLRALGKARALAKPR